METNSPVRTGGGKKTIEKRPYKFKELCIIYKVSPKTFRKWLKYYCREVGERKGHYFQIWQVRTIFKKLDVPAEWEIDNDFFSDDGHSAV